MKYMFILSALTFALSAQAQVSPECYRGSNSPALNHDGKEEARQAEQECMKKKTAGVDSNVPRLPASATDEQLRTAFRSACFRYTDSSMYPDMRMELQQEEDGCIDEKIANFRKLNAGVPAGCELDVGVAIRCPEGIYKFQGNNDITKVNDEIRKSKDVSGNGSVQKSSKKPKSVAQ